MTFKAYADVEEQETVLCPSGFESYVLPALLGVDTVFCQFGYVGSRYGPTSIRWCMR